MSTDRPPRFSEWIFGLLVPHGAFGQGVLGDLHEEFVARARATSPRQARAWYRYQVLRLAGRFGLRKVLPFIHRSTPRTVVDVEVSRRGGQLMSRTGQDIRYAIRMLRRHPGFALTVVSTLAIGIGANAAIFTVVNGVLLEPLPFPQSQELVSVWGRFLPESGFDFPSFPLSEPEYVDYRDNNTSMEGVALSAYFGANFVAGAGEPERVAAAAVTANTFSLLGTTAHLGRSLTEDDDRPDAPSVALLSDGLWRRRFGADSSIVGQTIQLNGRPTEIVGVMPPGVAEAFPLARTELWTAYQLDEAALGDRQSHNSYSFARRRSDVTLTRAEAEMATLMARWKEDFPDIHTGHFLFLRPLLEDVVGNVRTALLLVLGAVAFVLLIVCANVANLLLARSAHRRRELALRRALGAGRGRIVGQLLTESAVLAGIGGLLGAGLAALGTKGLLAIHAGSIPRTNEINVDLTVLLFTGLITVATIVLFGLFPAWQSTAASSRAGLSGTGRGTIEGGSRLLLRRSLVVVETALSVMLVIGAGLTARSFARLVNEDPGFRVDRVLAAPLTLPSASYTAEQASDFLTQLLGRVRSLPGVQSASSVSNLPILHSRGVNDFRIEGQVEPGQGEVAWNAAFASPRIGYFETMGIPVIRGRTFDESDHAGSTPVAVINQAFARRFFDTDPLGQRIRFSAIEDSWRTIVGIVGDEKYEGLSVEARPGYYFPNEQALQDFEWATRFQTLVLHTTGDPVLAAPSVREIIRNLDPSLPVVGVQSMQDVVWTSIARPRFVMTLMVVFASVALALGAIGIYGVMAYGVAQRSSEIGIRIALGARARQVMQMVVVQGMAMAMIGVLGGLAGAIWLTRFMRSQLFEVSPTDPFTFAAVTITLSVVALLASYLPARRASKVSPISALRAE